MAHYLHTLLLALAFLFAVTLASPAASIFERDQGTCFQCIASPNNCDITAPCSNAFNQKLFCGCRPGYRAAGNPADISKQWRLPFKGHEHRVWVAPGVKCDTLCNAPFGEKPCSEVRLIDGCIRP